MNSISCTVRNKIILAIGCFFVAIVKSTCNSNVKKIMKDTVLLVQNIKLQLESIKEQQDVISESIKNVNVRLNNQEEIQNNNCSYSLYKQSGDILTSTEEDQKLVRENISSIKSLILDINSTLIKSNKEQKNIVENISSVKNEIHDICVNSTLSKHEDVTTKLRDTGNLVKELKNNTEKLPEMVKSVLEKYFLHLHDDHQQLYKLLSSEK